MGSFMTTHLHHHLSSAPCNCRLTARPSSQWRLACCHQSPKTASGIQVAAQLMRWSVACTMRFGSIAKVLAKCKLKYYRISECA